MKKALALAVMVLAALPGLAQQRLRIPEGAEVVIPPRGAAPMAATRPATRPRPETEAWPEEPGGTGWGAVLLPLAAGAIAALATTLPGGRSPVGGSIGGAGGAPGGGTLPAGGGGTPTSGPVRTR